MTKKEYLAIAEEEGRNTALSYRDCFASYSSHSYIRHFAVARFESYEYRYDDNHETKLKELPYYDEFKKKFINTFYNVMCDIVDKMPKSQNPYYLKALKDKK